MARTCTALADEAEKLVQPVPCRFPAEAALGHDNRYRPDPFEDAVMTLAALLAAGLDPNDVPQPDRSAVHQRHYDRTRAVLRAAIEQLEFLERHFAHQPDDAARFGAISDRAGELLEEMRLNVCRYWNVADCEGEA